MSDNGLSVAVVGCGLIGKRRAEQAKSHPATELRITIDANEASARAIAEEFGAEWATDYNKAITSDVDIVVVATPNGFLRDVAVAALDAGKHVLIEKPMGRNLDEALEMAAAADRAGRRLKIGFNHRYHPAIAEAHRRFSAGDVGEFIHARARYGHGGRPGYEKEWRGNPTLAGGGELTDQGVHVIDLLQWFVGAAPAEAFGYLQTAVWPLGQLEDNAFALLKWPNGTVASFHTAWTQWKNLFSFEVFGSKGSLVIDGLGKSYGTETLTMAIRKPEGGVPDMETLTYDGPDASWALEWEDFVKGIQTGGTFLGDAAEGVAVMRTLDAIYRAAQSNVPAPLRG